VRDQLYLSKKRSAEVHSELGYPGIVLSPGAAAMRLAAFLSPVARIASARGDERDPARSETRGEGRGLAQEA
jgi:hypothetical protein